MPYSSVDDLLTGNIPLPSTVSAEKFVDDASDEIDSQIGQIYQTPIDLSDTSTVTRPARLLLKRIANWLASGRLMMAAAAGSQRMEVHAYANKLVNDATAALQAIASGDVVIEGAVRTDAPTSDLFTGPQIFNKDAESNVDAFYDRISNPNYAYPDLLPNIGGMVR